jgi:hypothetical protein
LLSENISIIPMMLFSENSIYQNQMRICVANIEDMVLDDVLLKIKKFET